MSLKSTRKINIALIIAFVLITISACSSANNQDVQVLKEQVNLLQTQNALLQQNNSQQASTGNQEPSVPNVPGEGSTTDIQFITPTPESLPINPVPAGQPIIYGGWSMLVSTEIKTAGEFFAISTTVRNLGTTDRVFRYEINAVTVTDDQGNSYKFESPILTNCEANNGVSTNTDIASGDSQEINGSFGWGDCGEMAGLRNYQGPLPVSVKQLHVYFKNFGPFDGVEVVIDL
ncbi:MAG: hypothetical protein AB9897_00955 [Anaerolineaceae bacterium]